MGRPLRFTSPGQVYHLISRFVGREWFVRSSVERRVYLGLLGKAFATTDWRCMGYAVMSNHIHLALLAGEMQLVDWIRTPHSLFASWINGREQRIGSVFVRGPKLYAVRPDGVTRLMTYIHQNPVRAQVVRAPYETDWTSHRGYAGLDASPRWLDRDLGAALCSFATPARLAAWISGSRVSRADLEAVTDHEVDLGEQVDVPVADGLARWSF